MELRAQLDLADVVEAYVRAWTETDSSSQSQLLEQSVTDDFELVQPTARTVGRDAVVDHIAAFPTRWPQVAALRTTEPDEHHGFLRFDWTAVDHGGDVVLEGADIAELAPDGRLRRVVQFFGRRPDGPRSAP